MTAHHTSPNCASRSDEADRIDVGAGLTSAQVADRVADGRTNALPSRTGRTTGDIVRANVFTRINAILGVLLAIVLTTGSLINAAFGLLIIANSAIGIIQELRAKRTLDQLAVVAEARPRVRRDGHLVDLPRTEVVADDIIEIASGDQLIVDGVVVEDVSLEIDESLLTGEADAVAKDVGDDALSGSFVVAGSGATGPPRWARRPTPPGWSRRPASSPWSTPSCAAASTGSSPWSAGCWCPSVC